ncbi:oxidoreductase [Sphingobacterium alkalisoli]|uniref:Gfo/Idh/MocA family protein n=1 Tax=Sphingobacterium alkalisoli TaxID=1874115 RepID=UPI0019984F67|nr:Gfo/Idh/MocA family oxidoreductase [Sphingobacterium alkalisoli]GGH24084.1 oxidoreductase [Sphingobacterium alkalisoli]
MDFKKLDTIQWGMIGTGDVTEVKSGPAFSKIQNSRLVAVMARTLDRVKDYAERHNVLTYYTDAQQLIDDPQVNAIYIATPPNTHMEYAIRAMNAGKPVYVEKPMAMSVKECEQMNNISKQTGVPLFVAFYRRGMEYFNQVKELLSEGKIGTALTVDTKIVQSPFASDLDPEKHSWRIERSIGGEGYFVDLAPHTFDILDYLLGEIKIASGYAINIAGNYEVADTVATSWKFKSGVLGTGLWTFSSTQSVESDAVVITGTRGTISFSIFKQTPIEVRTDTGVERYDFDRPQHIQMGLIQMIVDELIGKGISPSTGTSGIRTAKVMEQILR